MWKSFFILLFSILFLYAETNIQKGDIEFAGQNYKEAVKFYKKALEKKEKKAKIKLTLSYLKLGDNFLRIQRYKSALEYYTLAKDLGSKVALLRLAKLYENIGDLYKKGKKYKEAYNSYNEAYILGNKEVKDKLQSVKNILEHYEKLSKGDSREIVDHTSPSWTRAIGRLIVPTKLEVLNRGYKLSQKKCSATLVNFSNINNSKVIVTASHCLTNFNKKAGTIRFIIKDREGNIIHKYAKVLEDSFYNKDNPDRSSDYAILVLSSFIGKGEVEPLLIPNVGFTKIKDVAKYSHGSMAGFSRDVGEHGFHLSYDPKCELKRFNNIYAKSTCTAFNGASGGAVVMSASNDNENFRHYFVGVISHFRDDDFKSLYFTPHHIFLNKLTSAVRRYNLKQ